MEITKFKNDEELKETFFSLKNKFLEEDKTLSEETAEGMSVVLCCYKYLGKEEINKKELDGYTPIILRKVKEQNKIIGQ